MPRSGTLADISARVVFRTLNRPYVALLRAAVVMALLAIPSHAAAQIYTWQDANGSLIVSNVPQGTNLGIPSYEVPASDTVRATRYVPPERSRSFDGPLLSFVVRKTRFQAINEDAGPPSTVSSRRARTSIWMQMTETGPRVDWRFASICAALLMCGGRATEGRIAMCCGGVWRYTRRSLLGTRGADGA